MHCLEQIFCGDTFFKLYKDIKIDLNLFTGGKEFDILKTITVWIV